MQCDAFLKKDKAANFMSMKDPHPTRTFHHIEVLESRIAPAAITFSFTDKDGHPVTITSSKGTDLQSAVTPLDGNNTATDVFRLTLGAAFKGADISIVAGTDATDAVTTHVGFLNATGIDLGKVTVDG